MTVTSEFTVEPTAQNLFCGYTSQLPVGKPHEGQLIIDLDSTADPTHGQQQLTMFNGFYDQHQYLPMMLFEGETRMPPGALLRQGTAHAGLGAVEIGRRMSNACVNTGPTSRFLFVVTRV